MEEHTPGSSPPVWLPKAVLSIIGVVAGLLALLWVLAQLRTLLFLLFVSLFVAIALEPAVQKLVKMGWRRGWATGAVFLSGFLLGVALVGSLVPVFITQASQLVQDIPGYVEDLQELAEQFFDIDLLSNDAVLQLEDFGSTLTRYGSAVAGGVFTVGNTVIGLVFQMVTVALFSFYMVAEGPKMRRVVLSFLPQARQRELLNIWEISVEKTGGYIYSRAILAAVAALFTIAVLVLLGVQYPLALGLWVGLLSQFVPVVGTYIALVLPAVVALIDSPWTALWVVVALVAYQQIENYLVAPKITARTMAIHPAVSIGAVIAGAALLGPIGAVLALPAAATIQAVASTTIHRHQLISEAQEAEPKRSKSAQNQT